jgi:anti-sigma B factor antagonist
MSISFRDIDDIRIISVRNKIELGRGDVALRNHIMESLEENKKKIILDLEKTTYIDSAGVGELTRSFTTVANSGGSLVLLNLTKKSRDLLTLTKLITVFDVFDDEKEALDFLKKT